MIRRSVYLLGELIEIFGSIGQSVEELIVLGATLVQVVKRNCDPFVSEGVAALRRESDTQLRTGARTSGRPFSPKHSAPLRLIGCSFGRSIDPLTSSPVSQLN